MKNLLISFSKKKMSIKEQVIEEFKKYKLKYDDKYNKDLPLLYRLFVNDDLNLPRDVFINYNRVGMYYEYKKKDFEKAKEHYLLASYFEETKYAGKSNLAFLIKDKQPKEAIKLWEECKEWELKDIFQYDLMECYIKIKNWEKALPVIDKLIRNKHYDAIAELAQYFAFKGEPETRKSILKEGIKLGNQHCQRMLTAVYMDEKDWKNAVIEVEKIDIENYKDDFVTLSMYIFCYLGINEIGKVKIYYKQLIELDKNEKLEKLLKDVKDEFNIDLNSLI